MASLGTRAGLRRYWGHVMVIRSLVCRQAKFRVERAHSEFSFLAVSEIYELRVCQQVLNLVEIQTSTQIDVRKAIYSERQRSPR